MTLGRIPGWYTPTGMTDPCAPDAALVEWLKNALRDTVDTL